MKVKDILKKIGAILVLVIIVIIAVLISGEQESENIILTKSTYDTLNINEEELNIFYLNVGQADSTLIIMENEIMLIDAGDAEDGEQITEFMQAQGIEKIDYLIETHEDSDHSGGMETIVENFEVTVMYMPQSAIDECSFADEVNIQIFDNLDETYTLGNAEWQVLNVNNDEDVSSSKDNDTSIIVQLNYDNNKFLFMGDASSTVERTLLKADKLGKIDVLKVGHHGSSSSSCQAFLDVILPTYSIISVNNSEYKYHPADDTIERLEAINSIIYRTDEDGTIWITSDGSNVNIETLDINLNGN